MSYFKLIIVSAVIFTTNGLALLENFEYQLKQKHHFNYFILAQIWPQTVCYNWTITSSKNTCKLPVEKVWTIHGFWPTITQINGPKYCANKWNLNFESLKQIQQELNTKWIDVKNKTDPHNFLKYQWTKHGTCAISHPKLNNEYKYFKKTLEIFNNFDVTRIFTKTGLHVGEKYFVEDFINSIESITKKKCQIDCTFDRQRKQDYLYQIKICFDKSFKLIDCSKSNKTYSNCSFKKKILYLDSVPDQLKSNLQDL